VEGEMPLVVRLFLVVLLFAASVVCVGIPLLLQYRHMRSDPVHFMPDEPSREELFGTLLGVLFIDLLLYSLYRSTLPKSFFYPLLFGLNLLCLLFACHNFVIHWFYQRILRDSPSSEKVEMVVEMEPSQI
jgi:hypothetical protein